MGLYEKLEFDKICKIVASLASSDVVSECLTHTEPTQDLKKANLLLTQTFDALRILASSKPDIAFDDIQPVIKKVRVGGRLCSAQFFVVKRSPTAV